VRNEEEKNRKRKKRRVVGGIRKGSVCQRFVQQRKSASKDGILMLVIPQTLSHPTTEQNGEKEERKEDHFT
jgi:mRNA degradation ribonuclease J1/J2